MNSLSLQLCNLILPHVLAKACESRVPREGEKWEQVNCFNTSIDKDRRPYLIILGLSDNELDCIEWDGSRYQIERRIPLASFRLSDFQITHYYGTAEIRSQGILEFLLHRATRWPYIKDHVLRWLDSFGQYVFNKKKLITKQRMELLNFLVGKALSGENEHGVVALMTSLYTIKWVLHPQAERQQQRLEFYLDSLVETGELRMINHRYVVTGEALRTIDEYEEKERKHTENVKMQRRMIFLTFVIAALTLVQAGLIRLPAILDLTPK